MALPSYMKQDGDTLFYKGSGELIYYVPEKYFELSVAEIEGEYVKTMGIFAYCNFSSTGRPDGVKPFKAPTMIKCKPSFIEKVNNYQLEGSKNPNTYRLLKFHDGDELICNLSVPKDVDNVDKFLKLLIRGHLPDYIPYNEIQDYMILNAKLNGFNYKVSNQIMGLVISQLCRDPNDLYKPFRYTDMKDMTAYKAININMVPKYTSPYTAVISENPDEAIAGAILSNDSKSSSPLEKVMMN